MNLIVPQISFSVGHIFENLLNKNPQKLVPTK